MTAVKVDPGFVELLRTRAAVHGRARVVEADMLGFAPDRPADVALFFESFHHCADHLSMLENLRRVVRPGGWLVLAVYAMRKHGWLELGFEKGYLMRTLRRWGWAPRRFRSSISAAADVIVAQRLDVAHPQAT